MSDVLLYLTAALALFLVGGLAIFMLPRGVLLVLLILVRTVASVGSSSADGDLLPGGIISGAVAVAALAALFLPAKDRLSAKMVAGAWIVFAAFTFWTVVTILYFGLKTDYINDLLRVASLIAIFVLAYNVGRESPEQLPRLFNWVVGIPAFLLIVGYFLGLEATMNMAGRATGTFSHANQAGAYFAVGMLACLWGYWRSADKAALGVAFLSLVSLLLSQSLGALAAAGIGAVVMVVTNAKLSAGRRYLLLITGIAIVVGLFYAVGASGRLSELQDVNYGDAESDNSLDWRFVNWKILAEIWWERSPIFGLGFGSTSDEVQPLGTAAHSIFIQLLVETGIAGTVVATVVSAALLRSILRRFQPHPDSAGAMLGICTVVFVHGMASNWLGYSSAQYLALFIVGSLLGLSRLNGSEKRNRISVSLDKSANAGQV